MGKRRRLNVITAILKINAACSTPICDFTDKAGQGQRGVGSRQRLQELKQNKNVSDSVHLDQHQDIGTGCSPELKCSTSSSQGP